MMAMPCAARSAIMRVDLGLRLHVDALGRLVEDQERGAVASHFASTTFCWLPPESAETGWA